MKRRRNTLLYPADGSQDPYKAMAASMRRRIKDKKKERTVGMCAVLGAAYGMK